MQIERPIETVKNVTVDSVETQIKANKGKNIEVTIANVMPASIIDQRTQEEIEKIAVYFGEIDERLLLNQTNQTILFDALGGETDVWEGKKIKLTIGTYKDNAGGIGKGVRVKV